MENVTLRLTVIDKETEKAVHVLYTHNQDNMVINAWLPKSQIAVNAVEVLDEYSYGMGEQTYKTQLSVALQLGGKLVDIECPAWLAQKNCVQSFNPNNHYAK